MKKGLLISFLLLILMVSLFIGCSDDDKTIAAAAAQGYLIGYVNLYPQFDFYADIMPMTNNGFTIDSIVTNDSIADYRDDSYWNVYGDDNYQWASLYSDSTNYQPGDTAEVVFYRNNTMTSVQVRLLDYTIGPNYILPISNDTVSLGTPINIIWNNNQDADWYGISYRYYKDSSGTAVTTRTYKSVSDTTFTIPGSENVFNGYYRIYLIAVNGPTEGDPLNLDGAGLLGELHSYTTSEFRRVYVGTGSTTTSANFPEEPEITPQKASRMMMDYFTGHTLKKDNH